MADEILHFAQNDGIGVHFVILNISETSRASLAMLNEVNYLREDV